MWQWSTGVQVTSALLIAVFFLALRRTDDNAALRWWVRAWGANLAALGVTVAFWLLQPPASMFGVVRGAYLGTKTAFVLLVVQGSLALRNPNARLARAQFAVPALLVWAAAGAYLFGSIALIGVAEHAAIALAFAACGVSLLRRDGGSHVGLGWLAAGMLIRAALAVAEASAYAVRVVDPSRATGLDQPLGVFLAAHSSLATGAEWLLALGCVLALSQRAHAELRRLADADALTGLAARRALPGLLRDAGAAGNATLLFVDLDGFKQINDRLGHHAGDELLVRFGRALVEAFPAPHAVVRYAGDEFVVIARGLSLPALEARVDQLFASGVAFSHGAASLARGGDPEAALRSADEAMYVAKARRGEVALVAG